MNAFRTLRQDARVHTLAVGLAVAGLVVRALIPMGYMPGNLLAGEVMVLCPTGLPAHVFESVHRHHGDMELMVDADRACPIGGALQYAALPTDLVHVNATPADKAAPQQAPAVRPGKKSLRVFLARAPPAIRN